MFLDENTKVVIQGITGKEGARAAKEMIEYGTKVSCGVTPGKKGQIVEGIPVFDSIEEALSFDKFINASVLIVPPMSVYEAALEAIENGIKTILIVTENVPIKDVSKIIEKAKEKNCMIIGPSSIGAMRVGKVKLGLLGGRAYSEGNTAIVSKSGGMCSETALILTQKGIGQSIVIGIGGDVLICSDFYDIFKILEEDADTKAIVMYGEAGGKYEEIVAEAISSGKITKPVIAFIAGKFIEKINRELPMGHTGAIIEKGVGKVEDKKKALREAGAYVADYHHEIPLLVRKALEKNGI